jgi:Flp pilus assembly pilin Flp
MSAFVQRLAGLWQDEDGFIVSAELVLIATIVVLALVVGLSAVRTSIVSELVDIANAFGHSNQSHSGDGHSYRDSMDSYSVELFAPSGGE